MKHVPSLLIASLAECCLSASTNLHSQQILKSLEKGVSKKSTLVGKHQLSLDVGGFSTRFTIFRLDSPYPGAIDRLSELAAGTFFCR